MILYIIFGLLLTSLAVLIGCYLLYKYFLTETVNPDLFKLYDPEYFEAKKKKLIPEKPQVESFDNEVYHTND